VLTFAPKKAPFAELLRKANDILYCAVKGISDIIMVEGEINVDFADVRTVMSEASLALMGTGTASGENRAREAATRAITSPLLEDVSIDGAKAVLYNITASRDITGDEIHEIGTTINEAVDPGAEVIMGMVYGDNAGDEVRITVIATGINAPAHLAAASGAQHRSPKVTSFSPPAQTPQTQQTLQAPPGPSAQRQPRRTPEWLFSDEKNEDPTYLRKGRAHGHMKEHKQRAPGEEDCTYDEVEFIPAFIRRLAD